jgi:hypothetical protein
MTRSRSAPRLDHGADLPEHERSPPGKHSGHHGRCEAPREVEQAHRVDLEVPIERRRIDLHERSPGASEGYLIAMLARTNSSTDNSVRTPECRSVPARSRKKPFPYRDIWDPLVRIFDAFGLNRCMWGTDWTRAVAFLTQAGRRCIPFHGPIVRRREGDPNGRDAP